jgi:lysophospholipase L1-like esterase
VRRASLLVLGVCLVELGLQAAAGFHSWRESRAAGGANWRGARVRILCLGESTTAPNDHAWPLQLQRLLDERAGPGRYAVINAAHGATTSGLILARLPPLLDEYRPQLVIAMTGINDSRWFGIYADQAVSPSPWRRWAARSKLLKLLAYAYRETRRRSTEPMRGDAALRLLSEADAERGRGRYREALDSYRRVFESEDAAPVSSAAGVRLADTIPPAAAADVYAALARREAADDGDDDRAAAVFHATDSPGPTRNGTSTVTAANYRRIGGLLRERGVRLAAMQYPTLSIGELERLIEFPPGTLFIGNEDNFRAALRRRRYDDLFVDRFGGSWGHCTAEGDRLIAENVLRRLTDAGVVLIEN